jgi:hypothetical protein
MGTLECPARYAKTFSNGPSVVCMSTSDFKVRALDIYRDFHQTYCSAVSFVGSIRSVLPSFVFAFGAVGGVNLLATQPDLCVCVYGRRKVGRSLRCRRQRRQDHMDPYRCRAPIFTDFMRLDAVGHANAAIESSSDQHSASHPSDRRGLLLNSRWQRHH